MSGFRRGLMANAAIEDYFKLVVQVTAEQAQPLLYDFSVAFAHGITGFIDIDWGDGNKETRTGLDNKINIIHYYSKPGIYTLKLRGEQIQRFGFGWDTVDGMVIDCNSNWSAVGGKVTVMDGSFFSETLFTGASFKSLPPNVQRTDDLFRGCSQCVINLDTLVANAPAEGWTELTNITRMFFSCGKVTGSRSAFLAKCPNVTNTEKWADGTATTE